MALYEWAAVAAAIWIGIGAVALMRIARALEVLVDVKRGGR